TKAFRGCFSPRVAQQRWWFRFKLWASLGSDCDEQAHEALKETVFEHRNQDPPKSADDELLPAVSALNNVRITSSSSTSSATKTSSASCLNTRHINWDLSPEMAKCVGFHTGAVVQYRGRDK
ncbi:hypothetical protein WG66_013628, partial [Moniliophthora roreri]